MAKNKTKESTVLITRFSALGDVVISVPVVYDVCRAHPDVQFVMLTRPWLYAYLILEDCLIAILQNKKCAKF